MRLPRDRQKQRSSWVYIGIAIFVGATFLFFIFSLTPSGLVAVKYRPTKVDVSAANFQPLNRSDSTVKNAWYDTVNQYMIIKLSDTYYHYCGVPVDIWAGLKVSSSPYSYYRETLRGNFDCRLQPAPTYE